MNMKIRKGFKFKLKTNAESGEKLSRFAGCCRYVWNKSLALQKARLNRGVPLLKYGELARMLTLWKQSEEHGFLAECHSQPLQQTLKDLDRAIWDCLTGTGKGFPRFKKRGRADSFRYPQGAKVDNRRVFLPKIGWVGFFKSREIAGTIKNATVSRGANGWYISIQTEIEHEVAAHEHPDSAVGIDVGVSCFCALSTGELVKPLNSFKKYQRKLAREQRKLARKQKGSRNRKKQKEIIRRIHTKIARCRRDFLHKLSTIISKNHAMIVVEDLNIAGMTAAARGTLESPGSNVKAKAGLNRSILDQGWGEFVRMLEYKSAWSGGCLVKVSPAYTSQKCSECGHVSRESRASRDAFRCIECGFECHADINAAKNILSAGPAAVNKACGGVPGSEQAPKKQEPAGNREGVRTSAA